MASRKRPTTKARRTAGTRARTPDGAVRRRKAKAGKNGNGRPKGSVVDQLTQPQDSTGSVAESMARTQRDISVSEFFAKNRHLLGFDNPRKALLTAIKEAVDNSLDACEEAGLAPDLKVCVRHLADMRYLVSVEDNGPGIVKQQIPNIFGKLLYGSKFHRLRMSRGQQGIGISAAGMYGLLTTGRSVKITSRTGPRRPAHYYEIQIDTKKNRPEIILDREVDWDAKHGTKVEIELEGRYKKGRQSVDEYLHQTAIANPHVEIIYATPEGDEVRYERATKELPVPPREIKPHPYGVELGVLIKMLKDSDARTVKSFLSREFSRVSSRVAERLCEKAQIRASTRPSRIARHEADKLYAAIQQTKIMAPSTDCVSPIGQELLQKGLAHVMQADLYAATTRPPAVYRGNPFQVEAALAYGHPEAQREAEDDAQSKNGELMRVLRFANRVPLLYQQSACAIYRSVLETNWRSYGLAQGRGALPTGPVVVVVHLASVWVPFTSESKEAVAHYPEIIKEIRLAVQECGRQLGRFLKRRKREAENERKRSYVEKYIPHVGIALRELLGLSAREENRVVCALKGILERSRD